MLTCEGLCFLGYFDVAGEDGGADEDEKEGVFVEVLGHLFEGDAVVREDSKNVLTCEGLCFFGYLMSRAKMGGRTRMDSWTWNLGQLGPLSGPSWTMKKDVVKMLKSGASCTREGRACCVSSHSPTPSSSMPLHLVPANVSFLHKHPLQLKKPLLTLHPWCFRHHAAPS